MPSTLTVSRLTKRFGDAAALDDVSLDVEAGMRVVLLGHNGAGKSTMMKIILGLIPATEGEVRVCGARPGSGAARAQVAYLPENVAFHPALTGAEQIRHYLSLRGENPAQAIDLLAQVGLAAVAGRRIGTYSKGMRQRIGLAQTLIGRPRLLVLDEPTSGLDPVSRRDFYDIIDRLAGQGVSVLLSSHALTEVEARGDLIVILSGGRLVVQGTLAQLRAQAGLPVTLRLTPAPGGTPALAAAFPEAVANNDGALTLACAPDQKLARLAQVTEFGAHLADIDVLPPSLEDVYSHFSRRDGQ